MQHTREQEVFELNIQRRSRFIMMASALISAFTVFSMVTLHLAGSLVATIAGGMVTLLQDGLEKAISGKTDLRQVLAACSR